MASRRSLQLLTVALVAWAGFGVWVLFRPDPDVPGLDPAVGHVVVFFFISMAIFGLLLRPLGTVRSLLAGLALVVVIAVSSEILQPILTETRQAQQGDLVGNGVGIAGALGVTALLIAVLRTPARRELVTSLICLVGLASSVIVVSVGAQKTLASIGCWGQGLVPIASVSGRPILHVDEQTARVGDRAAQALGDGTLALDSADLRCSVVRSGSYSIVATVVPDSIESGGPARIFTSSGGTELSDYNTHIGQEFDQLSLRIRSGNSQQWELVPDVFEEDKRVTVAVVVAEGQAVIFVDGERRARFDLEGGTFAEWDESFPIVIGDEFTRNRTFEGEIEMVSFFDRALTEDDPLLQAIEG